GTGGMDASEVVGLGPLLESFLVVRQGIGIGLRPADLVRDGVGIVGQIDARLVRGIGFRHLLQAVAQRHHARRGSLDQWLGLRKERVSVAVRLDRLSKVVVEFLRDVARELQVLLLVLPDGHMRGAINQDVGGHQRRIGVKTDRRILAFLPGLLLELVLAFEPAEAGDAFEHPASSACSATWLWLNTMCFFGSMPQAMKAAVTSRVFFGSCSGPPQTCSGWVIACRSTTQYMQSYLSCNATNFTMAPS